MRNSENTGSLGSMTATVAASACMMAAVLLFAAALLMFAARQADATPQYSQQTGKPCGQCHVNPAGGGKLKPAGQKFKDRGYK